MVANSLPTHTFIYEERDLSLPCARGYVCTVIERQDVYVACKYKYRMYNVRNVLTLKTGCADITVGL